jgi:hypothetical protein
MSINTIPSELFTKILRYIPLKSASSILRVNKEWNREYKGVINQDIHIIFEELAFRNPSYLLPYYYHWPGFKHNFIASKLISFGNAFNLNILIELYNIKNRLIIEIKKIDKDRKEIETLMDNYPDGWYPNELWKRHKQNHGSYSNRQKYHHIFNILLNLRQLPDAN